MVRTETITVVFTALRAAVAKHGGTEVKTTGDGLMLSFASAADAVACAVALQQAADAHARRNGGAPQIRVGASSGEATREAGDLFGAPVVEAARLCAAASAGQIVASDVVRTLARPWTLQASVSVPALPKLFHPTTKFPAPSVATAECSWKPVVYVFTCNSLPCNAPALL